jgi:hypothetical protein
MIKTMRDALAHLAEASRHVALLDGWEQAGRVGSFIASATNELKAKADEMQREEDERMRRFNAVPILQATLRFRDGKTRRVVVSMPNDRIEEPYIAESFHSALIKQGVVSCDEAWPVLVVDKYKRVVGRIGNGQCGDTCV